MRSCLSLPRRSGSEWPSDREQLFPGEYRVPDEAADPPPLRPGAIHEPLVGKHVIDDQGRVVARDPADAALVVGHDPRRERFAHLGNGATREREDTALLVGQPEGRQARAGELGGRLGDGSQQRVQLERARDATVDGRQRPDAGGLGVLGLVERRVPDRDGRLLGQELERGDLLAPKGMLAPVVDDQRAEDAILRGERGRRRGLEALPLDVGAAGGRQPELRVGQDVSCGHCASLAHRHTDGAAADRNRADHRVLLTQAARRPHYAELARGGVPQDDHRRLGAHDLERLADDGVEHLVEVERRGERLADGLHRVQQERAALGVAHVGEKRRRARDPALAVAPRDAACLEPQDPAVAGCHVRQLHRPGCLAREGAPHERGERGVAEQRQNRIGVTTDGVGPRHPGQVLHGQVPLEHLERGIEDDERLAEAVKEVPGNLVLLRNARHLPSMTGARGPMQ